ncbi:hypothetical protein ACHAXS_005376 [Conticribra weissflogii]
MRVSTAILSLWLFLGSNGALARSSGRPPSSSSSVSRRPGGSSRSRPSGGASSSRKRRMDPLDEFDDEAPVVGFDVESDDKYDDDGADDYDDYEEFDRRPAARASSSRRGPPPRGSAAPPRRPRFPDDYDDDYDEVIDDDDDSIDDEFSSRRRPPPSRSGGRRPPSRPSSSTSSSPSSRGPPSRRHEHRLVAYSNRPGHAPRRRGPPPPPVPSTFTRGLSALRDRIPDPAAVKDTVLSAATAAQEKTSQLSSNLYREVKGLTSSELEQVMLKATRPDDTPVKTKHVERLVGVTYQISGKYDIYDAVLRKLWNKMAEKDLRTKMKSVYVLHRFSVDGGPDHQEALKQRLRALRKTKDPKRKGSRYFDSKVLMGVDNTFEKKVEWMVHFSHCFTLNYYFQIPFLDATMPPTPVKLDLFHPFIFPTNRPTDPPKSIPTVPSNKNALNIASDPNQPEHQGTRAFLSRYAHYVLTRAQTFGGVFNEISLALLPSAPKPQPSSSSKKSRSKSGGGRSGKSASSSSAGKPKNPPLCEEHLKFAKMVLKAGLACTLHDGEESESTAMCVERVAADLMGLTAAVAVALKRELKAETGEGVDAGEDGDDACETDPALMRQWCEFYAEELLPDTKKFVKKTSSKLDAYGLYLPSRMSASVPQELLERGLKMGSAEESKEEQEGEELKEKAEESKEEKKEPENVGKLDTDKDEGDVSMAMSSSKGAATSPAEQDEYDEYEYDEYDEYDEE